MPVNTTTDTCIYAPFRGITPLSDKAAEISAPPYDALSSEEARLYAKGNPLSFLHISKAEIDFAPPVSPYEPRVYQQASKNFNQMLQNNLLHQSEHPHFYIYRMQTKENTQTGVVVAASCKAYKDGRIKRHEQTRFEKETDRFNQIKSLGAQTGPALLIQKTDQTFKSFLARFTAKTQPLFSFTDKQQVRHTLWVCENPADDVFIADFFARQNESYIADGHHRAAAAVRLAEENGTLETARFLAVAFFADELKILEYNRVVYGLNNLSYEDFLQKISASGFEIRQTASFRPQHKGQFGLYLNQKGYLITHTAEDQSRQDPVKSLDVSILADKILSQILNITDLRNCKNIAYVPGSRGEEEIRRLTDSRPDSAGFMLYPVSVSELEAVADRHLFMPPKSTWFTPKLADGVISYKE